MKVITQLGLLDISPESVVAIREAPVLPDSVEFSDLTYCIDFDDRYYSLDDYVVCISEKDAFKLSELSGIQIEGKEELVRKEEVIKMETSKAIYVPFPKQFVLHQWEEYFDISIAWKQKNDVNSSTGDKTEPVSAPASSITSRDKESMEYGENDQSISLIEQVFREQNNCMECEKQAHD